MANINLSTGIIAGSQIPLDGKGYFLSLEDMLDLGESDYKAYYYYDSLIVICRENQNQYIWREVLENETTGILPDGYTYPSGSISNGIDYSLKTYNYFLYYDSSNSNEEIIDTETKYISGSIYWVSGMLYRSTVISYKINGVQYFAPVTDLTLSNADILLNRIDVFAVDINNDVIILPGTNAENPIEPQPDNTQIKISLAYIPFNSTEPLNVSIEQVYDENIEWIGSLLNGTLPAVINFDSVADPSLNTKSIEGTTVGPANRFLFTKSFPLPIVGISSLAFDFKSKASESFSVSILIRKSGEVLSSIIVHSGSFGFNSLEVSEFKTINIPVSFFNLSVVDFDEIELGVVLPSGSITPITGFFMDNIRFISGIDNPPVDGSYLALSDTLDENFNDKDGYVPVVVNEDSLQFSRIPLFTDLYRGNSVIYGGIIHRPELGDLVYTVWATGFIINDKVYFENVSENVTLSTAPSGAGEKRIDVFYIEKLTESTPATAGVEEGTVDVSPLEPNLDLGIQAKVSFKLLDTNETTPPEVNTELVYNENTGEAAEWTNITIPVGSNIDYAINPYQGIKSIHVPAPSGTRLLFKNDSPIIFNEENNFIFAVRLNNKLKRNSIIKFGISNDPITSSSVVWGSKKVLNKYGISNNAEVWQLFTFPFSNFNYSGTEYQNVFFEFVDTPDLQIDMIQFQGGLNQPEKFDEHIKSTKQILNEGANGTSKYLEYGKRIVNSNVNSNYNLNHNLATDWKLVLTGDTTFTESNLPTGELTSEFTIKLTGAFVPTFPAYWTILGDSYDGGVWNFLAVQVHNGNSGFEEVTVFLSNF